MTNPPILMETVRTPGRALHHVGVSHPSSVASSDYQRMQRVLMQAAIAGQRAAHHIPTNCSINTCGLVDALYAACQEPQECWKGRTLPRWSLLREALADHGTSAGNRISWSRGVRKAVVIGVVPKIQNVTRLASNAAARAANDRNRDRRRHTARLLRGTPRVPLRGGRGSGASLRRANTCGGAPDAVPFQRPEVRGRRSHSTPYAAWSASQERALQCPAYI